MRELACFFLCDLLYAHGDEGTRNRGARIDSSSKKGLAAAGRIDRECRATLGLVAKGDGLSGFSWGTMARREGCKTRFVLRLYRMRKQSIAPGLLSFFAAGFVRQNSLQLISKSRV